ncbi:MAG: ribosomal protein S18-alanine N-acetyltransferase [Acidimicrobiales bacterium]
MAEAPSGTHRVAVVPMRSRHLRGVVAIEQQTSHRPWSKDLFASELKQASSRGFVAVRPNASVIGFGCLMSTGYEAHVTNIATDPTVRRQGVGTMVMLRLVAEAQDWGLESMTLEVRASNTAAQDMYRRFGFEADGVRPRYYAETGEDAIIMWAHDIVGDAYRDRIDRIIAQLGDTSA